MFITENITTPRQQPSAVALGFFDGVHLGHQAVIGQAVQVARELHLVPCVFTFSTMSGVPASKNHLTLLQTEAQKQAVMEQMGVQEIISPPFEAFKQLSPEDYVRHLLGEALRAQVVVCGENYHFGKAAAAGVKELAALTGELGIRLITVPPVLLDGQMVSSTRIRQAVREGDMELARRLLGAPFTMEGEVVHGKGLGSTIHSPTINLDIPADFTIPPHGVYLSRVSTPMGDYDGVTNIGVRPTVDGALPNCETFLLDFSGDLYGKTVRVALGKQLRGERRFADVQTLSEQIQQDIEAVKRLTGRK